MGNSAFVYSEFYDNIISLIDCICKALIDAYCCVVWTKPFLDRKSKAWLTGGVYAAIMLFFDFIPWKAPVLAYNGWSWRNGRALTIIPQIFSPQFLPMTVNQK